MTFWLLPPFATLMLFTGSVVFAVTAYAEHRSLDQLVSLTNSRAHALRSQLLIRQTGALLLDLETGQRGFIITGQVEFLEPYELAMRQLEITYADLKSSLAAEGAERSVLGLGPVVLDRLDVLVRRRLMQADQNVSRRFQVGDIALKDLPVYVDGKRVMDAIRKELGLLDQVEANIVAEQDRQVLSVQDKARRLSAVMPALALLLIAAACAMLWRERLLRDRTQGALRRANATLESQVSQRTLALQGAHDRIQAFAAELDAGIEAERRSLAREVHDQLGQVATGIKLMSMSLRGASAPADDATVDELVRLSDDAIDMARRISSALRPPMLDDLGLGAATQHFARGLARQSGVSVDVDVADGETLSPPQSNQLFRILQEATTNALRHAHASQITIRGRREDGHYRFEIQDDGRGPGAIRPGSTGLRNMRERAALMGASFEFGPAARRGTAVGIRLPLGATASEERAV